MRDRDIGIARFTGARQKPYVVIIADAPLKARSTPRVDADVMCDVGLSAPSPRMRPSQYPTERIGIAALPVTEARTDCPSSCFAPNRPIDPTAMKLRRVVVINDSYERGGNTPCSAIQKFSVRYGCMLLCGKLPPATAIAF